MISQRQSDTAAREPSLAPMPTGAHEMAALTTAVLVAIGERANWGDTARLVASAQAGRVIRTRAHGHVGSAPALPARGEHFGLTDLLLATDAKGRFDADRRA